MDIELRESQLREKGFIEQFKTSGMGATVRFYRHPDKKRFPYVYYYGEQKPNVTLLRANKYTDYFKLDYDCFSIKSTYGSIYGYCQCLNLSQFRNRYMETSRLVLAAHSSKIINLDVYPFWGILDWDDVELLDLEHEPIFLNSHSYENRLFAPSQRIEINGEKKNRTIHVIKYMKLAERDPDELLRQASEALGKQVTDVNEVLRMLAPNTKNNKDELAGMLQIDHKSRNEYITTYNALRLCTQAQNIRYKSDLRIKEQFNDYVFEPTDNMNNFTELGRRVYALKQNNFRIKLKSNKVYTYDITDGLMELGYAREYLEKCNLIESEIDKFRKENFLHLGNIQNILISKIRNINDYKISYEEACSQAKAIEEDLMRRLNILEKQLKNTKDLYKQELLKSINDNVIITMVNKITDVYPTFCYRGIDGFEIRFSNCEDCEVSFISSDRFAVIEAQGIYERVMYDDFAPNLFNTFEELSEEYKDFESDLAFRYYILREIDEDQVKNEKLQMYRDNKELAYRYGLQDSLTQPEVLKSEIA